jgi:DNA-binding NarL/FixJ family response regulator
MVRTRTCGGELIHPKQSFRAVRRASCRTSVDAKNWALGRAVPNVADNPLASSKISPSPGQEAGERHGQDVRIRILTVDDHPLLREGIATIINNQPDMVLAAGASTGREGIQRFHEHRPDVTLMDLRLPDLSGIDAVIAIRSEFPEARIIMLSTFNGDVDIQRALKAGAYGYLLKSTPRKDLIETIRRVHSGKKSIPPEVAANLAEHLNGGDLTDREVDVLRQIAGGGRNKDIADRLCISEETVKVHVRHIMEKLGASDRTEAMAIAVRRGIIRL